jgi:hypothetical protein
MVNLENDWVNLVLRLDYCLFLSLINHITRNHITRTTNNKNKKQITMLKTSVVVGIHIDAATVIDLVDDADVDCWNSQHES